MKRKGGVVVDDDGLPHTLDLLFLFTNRFGANTSTAVSLSFNVYSELASSVSRITLRGRRQKLYTRICDAVVIARLFVTHTFLYDLLKNKESRYSRVET